ncbi:PREDICTED: LRR receptor serine/threonine-kinase [Prunus dulcis]|uniref:PREDICTED: LRR receptor serine/threonine-kinase n=1 Tax=Prunus dulcis TaxID=3755 RepID=A0A5E4E3M7_PRUDU|nr:hypothetical protein L3X38_039139 [Prunus dulcis]VVA09589.1 PREDICTED: LRR receptor serine/threonine-kinase [Prunus dulcis]
MLKEIFLDSNHFNELANKIGNLDKLEMLKGPIPLAVFNMSSLTTLALRGNNMSGGLPDIICQHLLNLDVNVHPQCRSVSPAQRDFIGEQFKIAWKVHGKYSDLLAKDYFNLAFKFSEDVNVTKMFEDAAGTATVGKYGDYNDFNTLLKCPKPVQWRTVENYNWIVTTEF